MNPLSSLSLRCLIIAIIIFPLVFRWLPKTAMRPAGPDSSHSECVLVVGVSRPKVAAVFLSVMLISLYLTFHVLYDSAVYSIHVSILNINLKGEKKRIEIITNFFIFRLHLQFLKIESHFYPIASLAH